MVTLKCNQCGHKINPIDAYCRHCFQARVNDIDYLQEQLEKRNKIIEEQRLRIEQLKLKIRDLETKLFKRRMRRWSR